MTIGPFLALLGITIAWFLLPLIPALRELLAPTDTVPLDVVGRDAGDVAYFARGFRHYLARQLEQLPGIDRDFLGRLPDGTYFARVDRVPTVLDRGAQADGANDRLVVIESPTTLRGGETFLQELYAREDFRGGPRTVFRALLGDRTLVLGDHSHILRWVHANGALYVGRETQLLGRASSDGAIHLGSGCTFTRVGAPQINTEARTGSDVVPSSSAAGAETRMFTLPEGTRAIGDHLRITGDFEIPWQTAVHSSLVITGDLRLGPRARIQGDVKTHGDANLDRGSRIDGSLISRQAVTLGEDAVIAGPVIAERILEIRAGVTIGSPNAPTTVTAPEIRVGRGVTIHGQLHATVLGTVL